MFRVRSEFQRTASLGTCASSFPISFLPQPSPPPPPFTTSRLGPPQPTPRPRLPNPALPGGSPRAAPGCAECGAVNWSHPGGCHSWRPRRSFPHSLSGQREAPGMAHDVTWGLVTIPRCVAVRSVETTPRTKSERPSSPLCPGTQLWFQTGRVRKVCLA